MSFASNPSSRRFGHKGSARRKILTRPEDASLIEILDRVLDHGIVVDPSSKIRLLQFEPRKRHEHFVVDWRDTYF